MAKNSWIKLNASEEEELKTLAASLEHSPGYRVLDKNAIPNVLSPVLRAKCDSAVVMASGTAGGTVLLVCNALRVDRKAEAIDQEPFAVALLPDAASPSGLYLHHGNWPGRTNFDLPPDFWQHVDASGVGNFCPSNQLPPQRAGPLSDIAGSSHEYAFVSVIRRLQQNGQVG